MDWDLLPSDSFVVLRLSTRVSVSLSLHIHSQIWKRRLLPFIKRRIPSSTEVALMQMVRWLETFLTFQGGIFEALLHPEKDAIFSDALNHASIIDGMRLFKGTKHVYKVFLKVNV